MRKFLTALKADLLDRRLLPILALVGVALAAAVGYAVLGGGGSTPATPPVSSSAPPSLGAAAIAVRQAPANPDQSVAETTSGASHQRAGLARNPFTPLPGSTARTSPSASTTATTRSTSSAKSTPSESGSVSKGSVETKPTATPKSSTPAEPKTVYHVAVLFGIAAPGTPPENVQLKSYPNLKRLRALPSAKAPLVVFRGVTAGGTDATFTLVGEAILHGAATCIPSASQCQAIDLKPGQTEELESLPANGAPITYRLELVSITSSSASAAAARRAFHEESKPGRDLLRRIGLVALPGMHYSKVKGVLVFGGHPALAVRVHAVAPARHDKR